MNHGRALSLTAIACLAPTALAQDFLLVADGAGDKIVRFRYPSGQPFDHFVGQGLGQLDGPQHLAVDTDGSILVPSRDTNTVRNYNAGTGEFIKNVVTAGLGGLSGPKAVCVGPDGSYYVASSLNNQVIKYTAQGAFDRVLISVGLQDPSAMAFGPDGNLYVASRGNHKVRFYDPVTGERIDIVDTENVNLLAPNGLIFDNAGNLYITGRDSNNVIRKTPFGNATTFIPPGQGLFTGPGQMIIDDQGNLVIACGGSNSVLRYGLPNGNFLGAVVFSATLGGLQSTSGIAFSDDEGGGGFAGCNPADINQDGAINLDDIEGFVENFLLGCPGGG